MYKLDLPFLLDVTSISKNPEGFPDCLDFVLSICEKTGVYYQVPYDTVNRLNIASYEHGSLLGTAMDDSELGYKYASDFFQYIQNSLPNLRAYSVLEIGCGRGALLNLLSGKTKSCIGVEPGKQNANYWEKYGVSVVNASFPSDDIKGPYDLIIGFLLLEHIHNLDNFFENINKIISSNGVVVFAVPDCTEFIEDGDLGMLIHQHYYYFSRSSIGSVLKQYGYKVINLENSKHGKILYVIASKLPDVTHSITDKYNNLAMFIEKSEKIKSKLNELSNNVSELGVYCPARIINFLGNNKLNLRFFDDNPELHNKYYPGFNYKIENFSDLQEKPVEKIIIASRAFEHIIADKIYSNKIMNKNNIILWSDFVKNE